MSFFRKPSGVAKGLSVIASGLQFGPVIQNTNPERQDRKRKMKYLGLDNMKQYRQWVKDQRRLKKDKNISS